MVAKLEPYRTLCRILVEGRMSGPEFETVFLSVFRGEGDQFQPPVASAVRRLFDAVEAYCADPGLRDPGDLDESGLRQAAAEFLRSEER